MRVKRIYLAAILIFLAGILYGVHSAFATNGAFPYTKHGGGTVDGMPFSGVDRAVNPDYGVYYNSLSPEAGQYKSGECSQCHEPHASFGGSEPAPQNGASDPYLLMRYGSSVTNYSELCWYCHESINYDPGYSGGTGLWKFYQGKSVFQASSHYNPPAGSFYWPGTTGDPVTVWPRNNRSGLPSGNRGSCLNCHTPHGIKENSGTPFDTSAVPTSPTNRHLAANNPSVSADYLIPRQLIAWEEALCENCHDGSGPSTKNIQDEINKRSVANQSGHPVDDTSLAGRHVANESIPITTKHVECYDCHNPHSAKNPTGVLGDGDGGRVKGMKYVDINGNVKSPTARQPYVYEVCFRCHANSFDCIMPNKALGASDGTAGCTPIATRNRGNESGAGNNDQRGASNKRIEFNPNTVIGTTHGADATKTNGAYHPVYAAGRNTSIQLCKQLEAAFGLSCISQGTATAALSNLTINCTDCHNNNDTSTSTGPVTESNLRTTDKSSTYAGASPVGPHGSTAYRILRANYNTKISADTALCGMGCSIGNAGAIAAMDTNFALCFLCHNSTPFKTLADSTWTNFYASGGGVWSKSLHYYHLSMGPTSDGEYLKCHECHNNVHSNVEAYNTQYYSGASCCTGYPSDDKTHLLNFGPQATPDNYAKPAWFYNSTSSVFQCNLRCHGMTMSSCEYRGAYDGTTGGGGWC